MVKVREAPAAVPTPSAINKEVAAATGSPLPTVDEKTIEGVEHQNVTDLADFNQKRDGNFRFTFYEAGL